MTDWLKNLFQNQEMLEMGHCQRLEDLNLGMGWIYYGLARLLRPKTVVVIGSWRGFTPIVLGKALIDNNEKGKVIFIDPSMVDEFWKDKVKTQRHFKKYGAPNVKHFLMTTQDFAKTPDYTSLGPIGILMIDGYHTKEQVKFDYEAFLPLLQSDGLILFHDSSKIKPSAIYGNDRPYTRTVCLFIDELRKDPALDVLHLPLASGLTIIKHKTPSPTKHGAP